MSTITDPNYKKLRLLVNIISIALPLIVGALFRLKVDINWPFNPYWLPALNAFLNGTCAVLLIGALVAVKKGNIKLHSRLIYAGMLVSLVFLVFYILYHISTGHTPYPEGASGRGLYLILLITHIILAGIQAPFVLYAFLYGYTNQIEKHKKIVKFSYPIWLYVSITGVICYLMIAPYYPA